MGESKDNQIPATVQLVLALLPLIVVIFAAGGGWYMLTDLRKSHDELEARVNLHLLERYQDERRLTGLEGDVKRMDRDVIAICGVVGAKCSE